MNLPAGFPYPLNQDVEISLEQIIPNPEQPRVFVIQEEIELLAASLRAKGQEVAARVRPLTEQERVAYPGAWVMLIGGHGRREAALLNQFKTLKCSIQDVNPEDTLATAARDNNVRGMHWWEWYLVIERADKAGGKSQRDIADELGQYITRVNCALKVLKTLNPAARALVQQNLQKSLKNGVRSTNTKNKGFSITEQHLLALADLEDQNQVQEALQTVLDDYLTADQAKKLVVSMKTGAPVEAHEVVLKAPRASKPALTPELASAVASQPPAHQTHPPRLAEAGSVPAASTISPVQMNIAETVAYDALAGVSVIAKIKTKLKKGEKPTAAETLLLAGHALWTAIHWLGKHGWKVTHWLIKETWKLFKTALKETFKALGPWVRKVVGVILLIIFWGSVIWLGWDIHEHGVMHPIHLAEAKFFASKPNADPSITNGSAQSNPGTQLGASSQMPVPTPMPALVPVQAATVVPTLEPTPIPTEVTAKPKKEMVVEAVPTIQAVPTVQKKDDVLGDVAKGANAVGSAAKLFGL